MKRYAEYKDSGIEWIGDIPKDWEVRKNRYLFCRVKNIVGDDELSYPVLSLSINGVIEKDREDNSGKTPAVYANYYQIIKLGNLLLCLFDMDVTPCLVGYVEKTGIISPAYSYFEPFKKESVSPKYYFYWYLRMHKENLFIPLSNNVRNSINNDDFKEIVAPYPPLNIQKVISNFLDTKTIAIDTLINDKQKLIELLKEKRQAIISEAVTKGLDKNIKMKDSGIEWIGVIPENWEIKRIKFIAKKTLMYGANESAEDDDPNFPRYIRITDINEHGHLNPKTFKSLPPDKASPYLLSEGDILFARSGATVGKTYIHKGDEQACFAGYLIKLSVDEKKALSEFVYYNTLTHRYVNWINLNTIQATIQNVSAEKYNNYEIAIPNISEQKKIVAYLDSQTLKLDSVLCDIQEQIEKLKEYRQSIISEVVTGKVMIEC